MNRQKEKFNVHLLKSWLAVAQSGNKSSLGFNEFDGNKLSMQELKSIIDEIEREGYDPINTHLDVATSSLFGDITLFVTFKRRKKEADQ